MLQFRAVPLRSLSALWLSTTIILATAAFGQAEAKSIKIGELNSYAEFPAFTVPYRNGWQLAVEEINAAGGVLGRTLEVISRDDGGTTGDALRAAEELLTKEKVEFLFGTFLSNVGLAVSDFSNRRKLPFLATQPLTDALTMERGNRYTYRLRPSVYMQTAMLAEAAKESDAKRWAIVAPDIAYGRSAAATFKALLSEHIEDAKVVVELYPPLGNPEPQGTAEAIVRAVPDAIFSAVYGRDLVGLLAAGAQVQLFEGKTVLSLLSGEPEWLLPLGANAPKGWIVTGYPWDQIEDEKHKAFVAAYSDKYNVPPRLGSLHGYQAVYLIRTMLDNAKSTDIEAMLSSLERLEFDVVTGPTSIRALDNQATLGAWVGKIGLEDGRPRMVDWSYKDGADYMVPQNQVRAIRTD